MIFAEVCRRRCPSGRRPQASQRPTDFRKAHRRDNFTGAAGTSFGGGGRLWSEAEPACLEVAATHLNDLRFCCGEGWILREAGEEGVFSAEAGDLWRTGIFRPEAGCGMSGRRFSLSPQARRNHPRNTGTLIRGSGDEFSRSGDECFQDFHPSHTKRGRGNIFRGLPRLARDRTRDRFSTQPRNEGTIFHGSWRDFQTAI